MLHLMTLLQCLQYRCLWRRRKLEEKMNDLLNDIIFMLFPLCLHHKWSVLSEVFVFNASLNDVAPTSPILLSMSLFVRGKSDDPRELYLCNYLFCALTSQIELIKLSVRFQCFAQRCSTCLSNLIPYGIVINKTSKIVLFSIFKTICTHNQERLSWVKC